MWDALAEVILDDLDGQEEGADLAEIYADIFAAFEADQENAQAHDQQPAQEQDQARERGDDDDDDEDGRDLERLAAAALPESEPAPPHAAGELSGDDDDADAGDAAASSSKERKVEEKPRTAKNPEAAIFLPEELGGGELRFNQRGFIRAHCALHEKCFRQRQVTAGRLGAGRPIGSLVAWLRQARKFDSKEAHIQAHPRSLKKRKAARELFANIPGADEFLAYEREKHDSETDDEPRVLP